MTPDIRVRGIFGWHSVTVSELLDVDQTDEPGDGPDFSDGKPPYDAGNEDDVKNAKRRAGRLAKARKDFILQHLMGSKPGRAYVWEMLTFCHVFHTSVVFGDSHATYMHEGERNVGLKLLADINRDAAGLYAIMVAEAEAPVNG